jgi:anti-anti-sigma factor
MTMASRTMIQKLGKVTVVDFIDTAITDNQQIQQITEELEQLIDDQDQKYLLLDFSSVKFLSSQTMGMLLTMHGSLIRKKGWLGICGLRKELYKAFQLTKLDKLFNFYKTEHEALNALGVCV